MSHVATVDLEIKDLDALKSACAELGLVFHEGQKTYRWWDHHVGDYPVPVGFTKHDLGKCEHAIGIKGSTTAYEIGLARYPQGTKRKVKLADGREVEQDVSGQWAMLFDFYDGGRGLMAQVGQNCGKLTQEYAAQVAMKQAKRQGFNVQRKTLQDGRVQLVCRR